MSEKFIDDLLQRNGYIVRVSGLPSELLISIDFAGQLTTSYEIFQDGDIDGFHYENNTLNTEQYVSLPRWILRLYILCDIYLQCKLSNLPDTIVRFFTAEGEKTDLLSLLPLELTLEETKREKMLNDIILKIFRDRSLVHSFDQKLEELSLSKTFNLLKGLLV